MVTAVTYQFQGWLASLMSNPRRRRTVIMIATATFVLILQLPNLLNFLAPWGRSAAGGPCQGRGRELTKLNRGLQSGEFDADGASRVDSRKSWTSKRSACSRLTAKTWEQLERTARLANMVLPIGWLPLGVMTAAEGTCCRRFWDCWA